MSKPGEDDFYVGYMKEAAPDLARAVRIKIIGLFVVIIAAAVAFAISQRNIGSGVFEFGSPRSFTGVVSAKPYPNLLVMEGDQFVRHHLVGFGKAGAAVDGFDGKMVSLEGTVVRRDDQVMLEIVPGTLTETAGEPTVDSGVKSLGTHTFVGEIVDSKCYLGVMNPGNLKTHKACAIRCISGGVPPVLLVRDSAGMAAYLMLVSSDGAPVNDQVLDLVAEPVRIHGAVERRDNLLYLKADPSSYERL